MKEQHKERQVFWTPYDQMAEHIGKKFTVLRVIPVEETNDIELEGEMFDIKLEDGEQIVAWYEEIYDKSCTVNGVLT